MAAWSPALKVTTGASRANLNPLRCPVAALPDQQADGVGPRRLERLMERARQRCGYIEPCAGKSWEESITVERGRAMLWYNSADGNTHVESEEVL